MTAKDLKNALLQEAVQGKLVPQIASEGNARDLLTAIQAEKAKLIKEGKLKKEEPLPEITEDEIPFDIPENWCWCRLGEVTCKLTDGSHNPPPPKNNGYPVISAMNIKNGKITFDNINRYTDQVGFEKENPRTNISKGDIILGIIGGSIGNIAIYDSDKKVIAQRSIAIINSFVLNLYISILLQSPFIQSLLHDSKGTAQGGIYLGALKSLYLPLPPLAEQKRIVTAIEQCMPLIDAYGKKEAELTALNANIEKTLKNAILQEAVQGKLVPQVASEGNARDLLAAIQAEKAKLIKEGKLKKEKPLPEITDDEIPFDIPENWCWVRWGELSESIQYGYNAPAKPSGKIRMIRITDIQDNKVLWNTVPYCDINDEEIPTYLIKQNDILFARTGGTVGKSFLVTDKVPYEAIYAGYLIRTRYSSKLVPQYLKYFMESQLYWNQLKDGTIATAQPNCNGQTLSKMLLPLPPLTEQKRIVEAIGKFLPLCEKLEE